MSQLFAALDAAWRVLLVGVLLGAGLPSLFALGIRAFAWGTGGDAEEHAPGSLPKGHPIGRIIGTVLFAAVIAVVAVGITYIVAHGLGWTLSFNGILPVLSPKG